MTLTERIESYGYLNVVIMDGYDDAFVGIMEHTDPETFEEIQTAVYSYEKIIAILMKDNMTEEEAVDYYDYNIVRALNYYGKGAPEIIYEV